jgi:hypothetical protein
MGDDIPEAYGHDQVDLFDNELFACAASRIDPIDGFLIQLHGGMKAPAGFTAQQCRTGRSNLSPRPILTELGKITTAISARPPQNFNPSHKGLPTIVNTYTKPEYKFGAVPPTESLVVAQKHVKRGFQVFLLHNSTPFVVMEWLPYFLRKAENKLTIFYVGHGADVKDLNGDDGDGFDEATVFDDGHILDDDLREVLVQNATAKARIALLSDCCYSGSV